MSYQNAEMMPFYKNLHKNKIWARKTQHTMDKRMTKKPTCNKQDITLLFTPPSKKRQNDNAAEKERHKEPPPSKVAIERCSEHSVTLESIGIGEFGMRMSRKGNMTTFNLAIRESLFPMVKFLGGTNTSLDYSTARADVNLWIVEKALQHC